jgi:two-component system, cell cycle sensor histidine kinase and response regulator CckA
MIFDLNLTVLDMDRMLRRLIGEDIELDSRLDPALHLVKADPGQIQQIILNLVLNARDAMPAGGRVWFETANVNVNEGGEMVPNADGKSNYVMLAVRDSGSGMSPEVKARIFEPFFTTKDPGKGTGLGLSNVHGILGRSGGFITVESEPGKGSRFKIFLPSAEQARMPAAAEPVPGAGASLRESATLLLVEDDETVRRFITRILSSLGYTVLEAKDGVTALLLGERCHEIDLLLTDVVMPHMNGVVLSERLKRTHADLRTVFMSGYTDLMLQPGNALVPEGRFLQKPFGQYELQQKVREALDSAREIGSSR